MVERPSARAVEAAPDGRTCLALYARMGREMYERVGPLVPVVLAEAAGGDRAVRRFVDTIEAERARGTAGIAAPVAMRFGLRPGLTARDAADILWTLTSLDVVHRMVHRRTWTLDPVRGVARRHHGRRAAGSPR